jgi:hypothetical protein
MPTQSFSLQQTMKVPLKAVQILFASAVSSLSSTFAATFVARSAGAITSAFIANNSSKSSTIRKTTSSSSSYPRQGHTMALASFPTIPLRDGTPHPAIGFGTYKVGFVPASSSSLVAGGNSAPSDVGSQVSACDCIGDALEVGYRFIEW